MILEEFALLASDTARTKAYLQAMIREDKLPGMCIVYSDNISKMQSEADNYILDESTEKKYFDIDMPILFSIKKSNISYILIEEKDINSRKIHDALQDLTQKYLIYSGYGGYILKPHLFKLDKKFIHVHAGILPDYRGSTTVYYSYLQEKNFGATAIFLSEGIDEGEMITQANFKLPDSPVDIDYIYEPFLRAELLIRVLNMYLKEGYLTGNIQKQDSAETYFIIHPVLKHIALLGIEQTQQKDDK